MQINVIILCVLRLLTTKLQLIHQIGVYLERRWHLPDLDIDLVVLRLIKSKSTTPGISIMFVSLSLVKLFSHDICELVSIFLRIRFQKLEVLHLSLWVALHHAHFWLKQHHVQVSKGVNNQVPSIVINVALEKYLRTQMLPDSHFWSLLLTCLRKIWTYIRFVSPTAYHCIPNFFGFDFSRHMLVRLCLFRASYCPYIICQKHSYWKKTSIFPLRWCVNVFEILYFQV